MARNLMVILSDPVAGEDDAYNKWYNEVHVHDAMSVKGIVRATRYKFVDVEVLPGTRIANRYFALYEIEADTDEEFEQVAHGLRQAFTGGQVVAATAINTEVVGPKPIDESFDTATVKAGFVRPIFDASR